MSRPFVPTLELRAVLAAVKAGPGDGRACGSRAATASLDRGCARRPCRIEVGTKKRAWSNKETHQATSLQLHQEFAAMPTSWLPRPHTRMTGHGMVPLVSIGVEDVQPGSAFRPWFCERAEQIASVVVTQPKNLSTL